MGLISAGAGGRGIVNRRYPELHPVYDMPRPLLLATLLLAPTALISCAGTFQSSATKIDDRTFRIEGPAVPGGVEAPNRRVAERVCPGGYRVLDSTRSKEGCSDGCSGATSTNWVIRCL